MCKKDLNTDHAHVQISGLYYEGSRMISSFFSKIEGKLHEDQINAIIQTYNYPNVQQSKLTTIQAYKLRKSKNKSYLTFFLY